MCRTPSQCAIQVSSNTLQQVEKFNYLRVVFTSDGRQHRDIDTRIVRQIFRELYHSIVTKQELLNTTKLSVLNRSLFRSSAMVMNLG